MESCLKDGFRRMNRKTGVHWWKYSLLLLRGDERLDRLAILCSVQFHIIPSQSSTF
jgi:hypothetical protein